MSAVYVDTSVLAGIAFGEPAAERFALALNRFDRLLSSSLLEAEMRAIFQREREAFDDDAIAGIEWILPTRPLSAEFATALSAANCAAPTSGTSPLPCTFPHSRKTSLSQPSIPNKAAQPPPSASPNAASNRLIRPK